MAARKKASETHDFAHPNLSEDFNTSLSNRFDQATARANTTEIVQSPQIQVKKERTTRHGKRERKPKKRKRADDGTLPVSEDPVKKPKEEPSPGRRRTKKRKTQPTKSISRFAAQGVTTKKKLGIVETLLALPNGQRILSLVGGEQGATQLMTSISKMPKGATSHDIQPFISLWERSGIDCMHTFSADVQVLIKTHYPCDYRTPFDRLLARYLILHPEQVPILLSPFIELLTPSTIAPEPEHAETPTENGSLSKGLDKSPPKETVQASSEAPEQGMPKEETAHKSPAGKSPGAKRKHTQGTLNRTMTYSRKIPPFYSLLPLFSATPPTPSTPNVSTPSPYSSYTPITSTLSSSIYSVHQSGITATSSTHTQSSFSSTQPLPCPRACEEIIRFLSYHYMTTYTPSDSTRSLHSQIANWLVDCLIDGPLELRTRFFQEQLQNCVTSMTTHPEGTQSPQRMTEQLSALVLRPYKKSQGMSLIQAFVPLLIAIGKEQQSSLAAAPGKLKLFLDSFKDVLKIYFSKPSTVVQSEKILELLLSSDKLGSETDFGSKGEAISMSSEKIHNDIQDSLLFSLFRVLLEKRKGTEDNVQHDAKDIGSIETLIENIKQQTTSEAQAHIKPAATGPKRRRSKGDKEKARKQRLAASWFYNHFLDPILESIYKDGPRETLSNEVDSPAEEMLVLVLRSHPELIFGKYRGKGRAGRTHIGLRMYDFVQHIERKCRGKESKARVLRLWEKAWTGTHWGGPRQGDKSLVLALMRIYQREGAALVKELAEQVFTVYLENWKQDDAQEVKKINVWVRFFMLEAREGMEPLFAIFLDFLERIYNQRKQGSAVVSVVHNQFVQVLRELAISDTLFQLSGSKVEKKSHTPRRDDSITQESGVISDEKLEGMSERNEGEGYTPWMRRAAMSLLHQSLTRSRILREHILSSDLVGQTLLQMLERSSTSTSVESASGASTSVLGGDPDACAAILDVLLSLLPPSGESGAATDRPPSLVWNTTRFWLTGNSEGVSVSNDILILIDLLRYPHSHVAERAFRYLKRLIQTDLTPSQPSRDEEAPEFIRHLLRMIWRRWTWFSRDSREEEGRRAVALVQGIAKRWKLELPGIILAIDRNLYESSTCSRRDPDLTLGHRFNAKTSGGSNAGPNPWLLALLQNLTVRNRDLIGEQWKQTLRKALLGMGLEWDCEEAREGEQARFELLAAVMTIPSCGEIVREKLAVVVEGVSMSSKVVRDLSVMILKRLVKAEDGSDLAQKVGQHFDWKLKSYTTEKRTKAFLESAIVEVYGKAKN